MIIGGCLALLFLVVPLLVGGAARLRDRHGR